MTLTDIRSQTSDEDVPTPSEASRGDARAIAERKKGRREGRHKGRKEGKRRAEIKLVARLLTQRFGYVDERALALLEDSTSEQRTAWAERVLTALTLRDVFGDALGPDRS